VSTPRWTQCPAVMAIGPMMKAYSMISSGSLGSGQA
jgi:hypothetical protein